MFLAEVVGTVVAPVQIPILDGHTLLLVRTIKPDGSPGGKTRIAIDQVQAGVGDVVLVLDEGNGGRQILGDPKGAVKTFVVGIVDYVDGEDRLLYDHRRPTARRAR
jgi:ethanolamine utilization protein EutN